MLQGRSPVLGVLSCPPELPADAEAHRGKGKLDWAGQACGGLELRPQRGGQRGLRPYQGAFRKAFRALRGPSVRLLGAQAPSPVLIPPSPGFLPESRSLLRLPALCPTWHIPVTLPMYPVISSRTVAWGLGRGSRGDMFTAGCDSVKWIFFLSTFLFLWGRS